MLVTFRVKRVKFYEFKYIKNMVNLLLFLFYMYTDMPHASFMLVKLNE